MEIEVAKFDRVLKEYVKLNRRTYSEIVNTKAYHITRAAVRFTRMAKKSHIKSFFSDPRRYTKTVIRTFKLNKMTTPWDLKTYAKKLKTIRLKSVSYLRAGWVPALKRFGRAVKKSRKYKGVMQRGKSKGKAQIATGRTGIARAWAKNMVGRGNAGGSQALKTWGEPALARAFRVERRSMKRYMEKKLKETARKKGISTR